jgi:hypothetical protein
MIIKINQLYLLHILHNEKCLLEEDVKLIQKTNGKETSTDHNELIVKLDNEGHGIDLLQKGCQNKQIEIFFEVGYKYICFGKTISGCEIKTQIDVICPNIRIIRNSQSSYYDTIFEVKEIIK